jgi:hypothetical protein
MDQPIRFEEFKVQGSKFKVRWDESLAPELGS